MQFIMILMIERPNQELLQLPTIYSSLNTFNVLVALEPRIGIKWASILALA